MRGEGSFAVEPPAAQAVDLFEFPPGKFERAPGLADTVRQIEGEIGRPRTPVGAFVFAFIGRQPFVNPFAPLDVSVVVARADCADAELKKEISFRRDQHVAPLHLIEAEESGRLAAELFPAARHTAPRGGRRRRQGAVIEPVGGDVRAQFRFIADLPRKVERYGLTEPVHPCRNAGGVCLFKLQRELRVAMFEHVGEEGELEDLPPPLPVVLQLPEAVAAPGDGNAFPALRIGKTEFGTMLLDEVGAGRLFRRQSAALPARFQGPHSLTGKTDGQEHLPDQLPGGGARTLSRQAAILQRQFEARRSLCKVGEGGAVFFQGNLRRDGLPLGTELRVAEGESAHGAAVDFDPVLCEMRRSGGRGEQGGRHEQRNRKSRPVHRVSPSAGGGMFLVLSIPYYMDEYK